MGLPELRLPLPQRLGNRLALMSSLQLLLVAGSLAALSFSLGRRSGLELSETYRQNATVVELSTRLSRKLNYPIWINALNLGWLQQQPGRERDYAALTERFATQMRVFPVDYINYGDADGAFLGMERSDDGTLLLNEDTSRSGRGSMAIYTLGADDRPGRLLERIPEMSSTHEEAWYTDTVKAGKPIWSAIYAWEDQPEVFSISYNAPLYNRRRQLQGVVGVDVVLSQLSGWLQGVWRDQRGLALIVEPNGDLVASSRPGDTLRRQGNRVERANLGQLQAPLAQAMRQGYFRPRPGGGLQLQPASLAPTRPPLRREIGGGSYTLDATPWGREEGLNWILLTALATDPHTTAERTSLLALLASAAGLAAAVALSARQIRSLLQPLSQLEQASQQLSQALAGAGDSPAALPFASGVGPADGTELIALDGSIRELVERYNALTANLQAARERERFRDAQTLALLKDKLRSSLQAAAVAHEINQPLSVLLLNSQLLLERSRRPDAPELPAPWREQLQSIRSEADRVVLTIEKMRALLRNVQTEHRRLDLREVAQSALLYARSGGATARVAIDSQLLDQLAQPAWIEGDAVQVQIAIVNLLRNAGEALQEAGTEPTWIGLSLSRQGQEWWLEVADNGPGLPADSLEAAPLRTTKADGSGLGLFVVRTTLENHHGSVEVATSPQGGALVRLRFPAADLPTTGD